MSPQSGAVRKEDGTDDVSADETQESEDSADDRETDSLDTIIDAYSRP